MCCRSDGLAGGAGCLTLASVCDRAWSCVRQCRPGGFSRRKRRVSCRLVRSTRRGVVPRQVRCKPSRMRCARSVLDVGEVRRRHVMPRCHMWRCHMWCCQVLSCHVWRGKMRCSVCSKAPRGRCEMRRCCHVGRGEVRRRRGHVWCCKMRGRCSHMRSGCSKMRRRHCRMRRWCSARPAGLGHDRAADAGCNQERGNRDQGQMAGHGRTPHYDQ